MRRRCSEEETCRQDRGGVTTAAIKVFCDLFLGGLEHIPVCGRVRTSSEPFNDRVTLFPF